MKLTTCTGMGVLWLLLTAATGPAAEPALARMMENVYPAKSREVPGRQQTVELSDHTKAVTVIFRRTRWELKSMPQSADLSMKMERDAMQLAESDRLKVMDRIDDHEQVWAVDLTQFPGAGAGLKPLLKPTELPHEFHRELAYLGRDGTRAWYGYQPIFEWVRAQKLMELKDGDDPLAAAMRGLEVEDRGTTTANSVQDILVAAGARALPYLKTGIDGPNFQRCVRVLSAIKDSAADQYLVTLAGGSRAEVAAVARHCLEFTFRPAALTLYLKWLDEDAGRRDVVNLLTSLAEKNPEALRPYVARIMDCPSTFREFRLAFETSRKLEGSPMPLELLELEKEIRKFGYRSGRNFDQHKVDALADTLLHASDPAAAAVIAVGLAVSQTKGDWTPINKAGLSILTLLPGGQGTKLLDQLMATCRDKDFQPRIESVRKM